MAQLLREVLPPETSVLLYVGAWTDAFPLTVPELRAEHTHFVFIDKEPGHQYNLYWSNDHGRSEQSIIVARNAGGHAASPARLHVNGTPAASEAATAAHWAPCAAAGAGKSSARPVMTSPSASTLDWDGSNAQRVLFPKPHARP